MWSMLMRPHARHLFWLTPLPDLFYSHGRGRPVPFSECREVRDFWDRMIPYLLLCFRSEAPRHRSRGIKKIPEIPGFRESPALEDQVGQSSFCFAMPINPASQTSGMPECPGFF